MLTLGEIHTGLLQNSVPLSSDQMAQALRPLSGEQISYYERPLPRALSAERPVGVDCRLPAQSGSNPHAVGTVMWRTGIVGGHLAQSSAYADVTESSERRRLHWSHYTALPGRLETLSKADHRDVAKGFLHGAKKPEHLDTYAIAAQALDRLQRSPLLDRRPAVRTRRTQLRWAVIGTGHMNDGAEASATFRVVSDDLRTVEVHVADEIMPAVLGLCEDLALHDWLLTTVSRLLELSLTKRLDNLAKTELLRPVIEYFLPLWMPGAWVDKNVEPVWQALEHRPGFTRQWRTSVERIRDQVRLSTIDLLKAASTVEPEAPVRPRPRLGPRPPRRLPLTGSRGRRPGQ
jgi:hypothetical protein